MSVLHYPSVMRALMLPSSSAAEVTQLGGYVVPKALDLRYMRVRLVKKGALTTETLQLKVYTTSTYDQSRLPVVSSNVVALADAAALVPSISTSSASVFTLRFDFTRTPMPVSTYYIGIVSTNYTRNALAAYIGVLADWPESAAKFTKSGGAARRFADVDIFGYRERRL